MPTDHFAGTDAENYDADHAERFAQDAIDPVVTILAELTGDGDALEFAIGTGRIALPLAARGLTVDGVDFSADMIEQLRSKPGGTALTTVVGDMATISMGRTYRLVYLVFNTIGNLMTQEAQVDCFANAARHLDRGGHFVIESNVPNLRRLTPGSHASVFDSSRQHVGVDHYTDLVAQQAVSRHVHLDDDGLARYRETPWRFTWPSELDLMARLAGLRLVDRWADWHRSPFTGESSAHVSVWQRS